MQQFEVRCGKEKVPVKFVVGCLCVTYRGKNYLIQHCAEKGWIMRLGKMPAERLARIAAAIEERVMAA